MRYRSKTLATWLAVFAGALGAQRFYLRGPRDGWAWAHLPFTLVGLWGAWRMHTLGQDDRLAWVLVPILGLTISVGMLAAIVIGLTPDARWDERYNAGLEPRTTGWLPVLGVIVALMLGGIALMGTIAFSGQRFFEWHQGQ
jgi:TM2 domain